MVKKKIFLFALLLGFLFIPKSVFAAPVEVTRPYFERSYYVQPFDYLNQTVGSMDMPYTLLYPSNSYSENRRLYGFRATQGLNYRPDDKFTLFHTEIDIYQQNPCSGSINTYFYDKATSIPVNMITILTDNTTRTTACNLAVHNRDYSKWTCDLSLTDYVGVNTFTIQAGWMSGSDVMAITDYSVQTDYCANLNHNGILTTHLYYNITSSQDPNLAVLNNVNNSINNQTTIIENSINNQTTTIDKDLNDINDTLNNDSVDGVSSDWLESISSSSSNTPISDLLTLPITLIQSYINGFSSTCSPVNLGNLYGTNLVIPCINLEERLGSSLWGLIDSMFCLFMIYNIAMFCVGIYESITSLDDGFQELYTPQHSGHTRVSRNEGLYD